MAGAGKVVAAAGAVLAIVAAGLFLAFDDRAPAPDGGAAAQGTAAARDPAGRPGRRHARTEGTSSVAGVVRLRRPDGPAAAQPVVLAAAGAADRTVATDAEGAFRFEKLPEGGPYELRVAAPGLATVRLPGIALARGEARDVGTLWLDRAVAVTVSVRTWADEPIEGAEVRAFPAADGTRGFDPSRAAAQLRAEPVPVARATTGADGRAVFAETASGQWTFTAEKPGFARDGRVRVRVSADGEPPVVTIHLATGHTLRGRVLDGDGAPLAGILVLGGRPSNAWDVAGAGLRSRSTSDREGRYELTALPTGDVALQLAPDGAVPFVAATVRVPQVKEFDLRLRSGGTLRGTVTMAEGGAPVEGATVRVSGASGRVVETTTDAEGRYVVAAVPDGPVTDLTAWKAGLVHDRGETPRGRTLQVGPGETATADLRMRAGTRVVGTVRGPGGPAAGAGVVVWTLHPVSGFAPTLRVVTGSDGRYAAGPVDRGAGLVQVTKEGLFQRGFPMDVYSALQSGGTGPHRFDAGGEAEVVVDVLLEPGSRIEGRVESPEGAVAGATVTFGSPGQSLAARSADDGTFAIDGAPPATRAALRAEKEGWLALPAEPVAVVADGPTTGVVLPMVRRPVVRGRATSASGTALRDGQATVVMKRPGNRDAKSPFEFGEGGPSGGGGAAAPIRADGTFEVPLPWAEGTFAVRATALDHAPAESPPVELAQGRADYEANVVLESGYRVRGRVASKGVAVAGAEVSMVSGSRGGRNTGVGGIPWRGDAGAVLAVTDAGGVFEIPNVAPGAYAVVARAEGYVDRAQPDVKVPTAGDVSIDLDASLEIAGRVAFADGTPAPGVQVSAVRQDDAAPAAAGRGRRAGSGASSTAFAGADGAFRVRGLVAGAYKLVVTPPQDGSVNARATDGDVVSAGTRDVRLVVRRGGSIAGVVVDRDGDPVEGAQVWARPVTPGGGDEGRSAFTRRDGTFEVVGLGDGDHHLAANPPAGGRAGLLFGRREGVPVGSRDVEIVMPEGLSLEGVLVDGTGRGLADVMLVLVPRRDARGVTPSVAPGAGTTTTDASGAFRFRGLHEGSFGVRIQSWPGRPHHGLVLAPGEDFAAGATGVRLVAALGERIAGTVVDERGAALSGAQVVAMSAAGAGASSAQSDAHGRFEIDALARGAYTLHVNAPGRPRVQVPEVEAGNAGLRIVVGRGGSISGRLLDAQGNAAAHVNLRFAGTGGTKAQSWTQVQPDGRFASEPLPDGTYEVTAHRPREGGQTPPPVPLGTVRAGETVELKLP